MNSPIGSSETNLPPSGASVPLEQPTPVLDLDNLAPGMRWRGIYKIEELSHDVTFGKVFSAIDLRSMEAVVVRSFRVGDGLRAQTWEKIRQLSQDSLLEFLEAVEEDGRRVEVMRASPSMTLRGWAADRKVTQVEIELIVRQLAQALGGMHGVGLVHLNVRADNIFVRTTAGGLNVILGGLETATLMQGVEPVEISADPFYAPPETVGLYHFLREPSLRAWDWWSLGRLVQEVVLGRHILGHILNRDVTRETMELRTRAENLLKEQDANMRAGAVEAMPAMNQDLAVLLRGLLTASRDGRWGFAEVEAWLRKEPVKERYLLSKNERLFFWRDRAYTVSEAAELFSRADQWQDGLTHVFGGTNNGTLAHFLETENAHRKTQERFDILLKLRDAPAFEQLPLEITHDVVMAVALKFLAGPHAPLVLRGKRVDKALLNGLLASDAQPAGLNTVHGLIAHPMVQQLERIDVEAARMLGELGRISEAARALAQTNAWITNGNLLQVATLLQQCLESESALREKRAAMQKVYACSRDSVLDELFKRKDLGVAELVVIAYTNCDPIRFKYVTHRQWNEEQFRLLSERGLTLAIAGLWLGLENALRSGPLIFGRLRLIIPIWFLIAIAVALVWQNMLAYAVAVVCPLVMLALRVLWFGIHRAELHNRMPAVALWTFRSGRSRCRHEAFAVLKTDQEPSSRELLASLDEINEAISRLALDPAPKPIPHPPGFGPTRTVGLACSAIMSVLLAVTVWYGIRHPPKIPPINWQRISRVWSSQDEARSGSAKEKPKPVLTVDQVPIGGVKSIQSTLEELRRAKREVERSVEPQVKMSWPFKTPSAAKTVTILENTQALPEQKAVAEELAQLLLGRYEPTTINALIAVQVPVEKGVGLMLYDGRTGKISDRKVYTIGFAPFPKTWIEIDSKKVIFLNGQ